MKNENNTSLSSEIKKVLKNYLKTQFVLVIITILLVWGIMLIIPNLHLVFEILIVIFSYLILSQIMDYFVSPYLLGKKTNISPIFIIFAFIIGVTFLGVIGIFLAVPIALVIKTVWNHYKN